MVHSYPYSDCRYNLGVTSTRYLVVRVLVSLAMLLPMSMQTLADEPDIIRIVSPFRTLTLDPTRSVFTGSIETFGQLYSRLFRRDENGELAPALALRWEISADGLDYTFFLREAKFSDGSPITADDVAFSLLRMRDDPEAAYPAPVLSMQAAWADDERTLRIRFDKPNAPFLESLEMCFLGIVSRADVERRGTVGAFAESPVTSGPYRVVEWRRNDRLVLEANPYYWREGYPRNDGAELIEVADSNTRIAMLRAGEADAVRVITSSSIAPLMADPEFTVPVEPAIRISTLLLNHDRPPFNDQRVREAAALALDMPRFTAVATRGRAETANTLLPYQLNYYDPDFPGWSYDPKRATELIKEAGAEGAEVAINITAPDAAWEMSALIVQSYWAAIGLDVQIHKMDQALYEQRLVDGDYDASIEWWYNETADPDLAVKWALCGTCGNRSYYTNYQNDRVDKLVHEGAAELDPDKRRDIYREIQSIAFLEVAQIPLFYNPWLNAYSTRIEGLRLTPATQWTLEEARHVR
jgi:peptide/nickel transport system substrate-binding protein